MWTVGCLARVTTEQNTKEETKTTRKLCYRKDDRTMRAI